MSSRLRSVPDEIGDHDDRMRSAESDDAHGPLAPAFSEDALADTFSREHAANWLHVAGWSSWLAWNGTVWRRDDVRQVPDLIRLVCRDAAGAAGEPRLKRRLASAATIAAVERIARSDPRHATRVTDWDAGPELLNTPAGVIDLRTGKLRRHRRSDRMTRIAGASRQGQCPGWLAFLDEVTGGDKAHARYLARMAGYCLTGLTTEHVLFFIHGEGANGKSVFLAMLRAILGSYATSAPIETFVAATGERHPTELADLVGARLVTVAETREGRRWDEAKLKAVTGGDPVKARFMRQDFFEFTPQFKLVVVGNHKPAIGSLDEAMRRRIHLVPFAVTIPPERRDPDLVEQLLTECDGILAWALDGLAEWRRIRLAPPPAVTGASAEYFEEEDAVGDWLAERRVLDAGAFASSTALFVDWKAWAELSGEPVHTKSWLGRELVKRGFRKDRHEGSRGFWGLCPKDPQAAPAIDEGG